MQDITATELNELLESGADVQLIDVRQPAEYNFSRIPGSKLIPLGELLNRMDELDPNREIIIHCKMGGRSAQAIMALERAGFKGRMRNLRGGITAWSNEVDPKVLKY
jgi:sulfur-carrier protein adenylyltransferase/sulfurtransferase